MLLLLSAAPGSNVDWLQVGMRFIEIAPFACLVSIVVIMAIRAGRPIIKEQRERRIRLEQKKRGLDRDYDPYASTETTAILMLCGVAMLINLFGWGWLYYDQNPDCTWLQIVTYIFGEGMSMFFGAFIAIFLVLCMVYLFVLSCQTSYWVKKTDEHKSEHFRARINGREVREYEKNY